MKPHGRFSDSCHHHPKLSNRWLGSKGQRAQTLFEYAIIIAAVALVVVLVLRGIGEYPPKALNPVNNALAQ